MAKMIVLLTIYLVAIFAVVAALFAMKVFPFSQTTPSNNVLQFEVTVQSVAYSPINETCGILNFTVLPQIASNESLWIRGYNISDTEIDIPPVQVMANRTFTIVQELSSSTTIVPVKLNCILLALGNDQVTPEQGPFSVDLYIPKNYDYTFSSGSNSTSTSGP